MKSHLSKLLVFFAALALPQLAAAQSLEPLNRVHLGLSMADEPSRLGIAGGLDSRLTRLLFVDAGGFGSLVTPELQDEDQGDGVGGVEDFRVRHGIYLAPGVRIPHVQPEAFSFDIFLRGGMAAIWLADVSSAERVGESFDYATEVAGYPGADLAIQRGKVGVRVSYRQLFCAPYVESARSDVILTTPHFSFEAQYQFGGRSG